MSRVKLRHAVKARWYFSEPAKIDILHRAIASWEGTPFHEFSKAKGRFGGVDCIRLVEAVDVECGLTDRKFAFPLVPLDFTCHQEISIILEFLRGKIAAGKSLIKGHEATQLHEEQSKHVAALFQEVWTRDESIDPDSIEPKNFDLMPGDHVCIRIGRAVNHLGIIHSGRDFVHCRQGVGVAISTLADHSYGSRLESIFRPILKESGRDNPIGGRDDRPTQ